MLVTVHNITNPAVAIDAGMFGLIAPGGHQTLSMQASVLEQVAPQLVSLQSKGYISYTVAFDPGTPANDQTVSSGLGGQLASPYAVGATAAVATGSTGGASAYSVTGYPSGAMHGITAGVPFQTGNFKAFLVAQATGPGSYTVQSDTFAIPTAQVAAGAVPTGGGTTINVPLQPGSNFQLTLTGSVLQSANLYEINS